MNTLDLAWRNILRNRRRSLLTLLALAVGAIAVLLFRGYVADTVNGLQTVTVRQTGHLQVVARGFLEFGRGNPGRFSIHDPERLVHAIQADPVLAPWVAVVTPQLQLQGVAGHSQSGMSSNYVGVGVVPSQQRAMLAWNASGTRIPPGTSALSDEASDSGVIGVGLAQLLGLCDALKIDNCRKLDGEVSASASGPTLPAELQQLSAEQARQQPGEGGAVAVDVLASTPSGAPNVMRLNVLQAQRQVVREIDAMYMAMPLALAQRLVFGPDQRAASAVVVQLKSTGRLEQARARLEAIAGAFEPPLQVLDFHDVSPVYDQIEATYATIFQFIAVLMGMVALFSVANAVGMSVSERTGEIGTLRALGFARGSIRRLFIAEGAVIGLLGSLAGTLLAVLIAQLVINAGGFSWTPPGRSQPVPLAVNVFDSPAALWGTVLGLTLVSCVSAWFPAARAARLEITEALRHG